MTGPAPAVVIGAGVVGCSVALALADQGHPVVVLDRGPGVGTGTTSASSAVVRFHYSTMAGVALAYESALMWADWEQVVGPVAPYARFHRIGAALYDSPQLPLSRLTGLLDRAGIRWEIWDGARSRRRCPALDPGRFGPPVPVDDDAFFTEPAGEVACLVTPDGGFVDDPQLAAVNLAAAARARGARFCFRAEVVAVPGSGPVQEVVLASGERLPAGVVVNCAGPWSDRVVAMAGVLDEMAVRTRPLRQEVHVLEAPDGFTVEDGGLSLTDPDLGTYFRPHPGGTLVVGGLEAECDPLEWVEDMDRLRPEVSLRGYETNAYRAARRLPELKVPPTPRGLASAYDVSDDWVPIYDRTSRPGLFLAIGTSGNQFKNAPMIGRLIAALVAAEERGQNHDGEPVQVYLPRSGLSLDLGVFSRLRDPHLTSGSVVG